jgi:Family of unknown function (DUF5678)
MDWLQQREIEDEKKLQLPKFMSESGSRVGSGGIFDLIGFAGTPQPPRAAQEPSSGEQFREGTLTIGHVQAVEWFCEIISERTIVRRTLSREEMEGIEPRPAKTQFRDRELEWRRTHHELLQQYQNEWVVLEGEQVIAHGTDPVQVIQEAKRRGILKPYIFFVEQEDSNVVRIGL